MQITVLKEDRSPYNEIRVCVKEETGIPNLLHMEISSPDQMAHSAIIELALGDAKILHQMIGGAIKQMGEKGI